MAKMLAMTKLMLLINLGLVWCGSVDPPTPKFSSSYSVKGNLYIPFAEIKEPFYAWYDVAEGKSRIDYYGGMVKTYQLSKNGTHGLSLKIAPMTTDTELNKISCFTAYGDPDAQIEPQSVLPDISEFKFIGNELVNGINLEKWRLVTSEGEKVNKYTLWVRYTKVQAGAYMDSFGADKDSAGADRGQQSGADRVQSGADRQAIPVRYEMKGFNSLLGSHYDHYYLNYEEYSPEKPEANVFDIESNMTCSGFPGPGDQHIITFNPMREFINNERLHHEAEFTRFKNEHNKFYTDKEHTARQNVFTQNLRFIHSKNRAGLSYKLGVNHLADRTDLEMKALRGHRHTGGYNGGQSFPYEKIGKSDYPESLDWTLYGAVTPVKDQSVCGSCWSFGTTGAVEGAYFMKHKKQAILSQQALIDCSWGYGNNGCDGGEDFRSYQWMLKHGGLPTEDDYGPYLGQDGYCHIANTTITAPITGFVNVTPNSEDALKLALAKHGPISVAIDASQKSFSFYSHGVYYDEKCKNSPDGLDHAVLAVGYGKLEDGTEGTTDSTSYWKVKNSWSTYWGNQGYILMSIKNNNCGVMTDPTYVTM